MTTEVKSVEHCRFEDLLKGDCDAETRQLIENYLEPFAKPADEGKCLKCGTVQGGLMAAILGGFTYGLQHGEGRCSKCHWPARANHYLKDKDGKGFGSMRIILQYHPDYVKEAA
jgi:hypothetical protein